MRLSPTSKQRLRHVQFIVVTLAGALLLVESASWAALCWSEHNPRAFGGARSRRTELASYLKRDTTASNWLLQNYRLHPYLGYMGPNWGAVYPEGSVVTRSPKRFIVGIFGGSVAMYLVQTPKGRQTLQKELARIPSLAGKEIILVGGAEGGFKQPQHLMALQYLLSKGAEFDLVLTLDGFNEIALYPVENLEQGLPLSYPRSWHLQAGQFSRTVELERQGKISFLKYARARWAAFCGRAFWSHSPFFALLWSTGDRLLAAYTNGLGVNKPPVQAVDRWDHWPKPSDWEPGKYQELAKLWGDSSREMFLSSKARGTLYLHVLQPNQYWPGSKPLAPEEIELVGSGKLTWSAHVEAGYPRLREEGARLTRLGIPFLDFSNLFSSETRSVYLDSCCHVNSLDNEILASSIAKATAQLLADSTVRTNATP